MSPNTKNGHLEYWEGKVERAAASRAKRGRPKMKVSGVGVKQLAKIIAKRAKG